MNFDNDECVSYGITIHDIVKSWWVNENKFKTNSHGTYSTTSCDAHIMHISMMLCRMFENKIPKHFTIDWVPIITIKFEHFCDKVETNFRRHRVVFATMMIFFFPSKFIRRSSNHTWIFIVLATGKGILFTIGKSSGSDEC